MASQRPPRIYTLNGLYRAFDRQIEQFAGAISDEVYYLDINFNHPMEMGPDDFGMYWIASLCNTGHQHIVLVPVAGYRPDAWPVAFYNEEVGTARIFSSSIRNWFPSYLIYLSEVPNYRRYFAGFAAELVDHCRRCFDFDATRLVQDRGAGNLDAADAYELTEPGSYLHRYWQLRRAEDRDGMRELAQAVPFFNAPLRWLLERSLANAEDILSVLQRPLRFDLGDSPLKLFQNLAPELSACIRPTPFEPFLSGSSSLASIALAVGRQRAEEGRFGEALTQFQNAAYLARGRDPQTQAQAVAAVSSLAPTLADRGYLSYLKELDRR